MAKDAKVRLNAPVNPKIEKISEIISKKVCIRLILYFFIFILGGIHEEQKIQNSGRGGPRNQRGLRRESERNDYNEKSQPVSINLFINLVNLFFWLIGG